MLQKITRKDGVEYAAGNLSGINEVHSTKAEGVIVTLKGDKKAQPLKVGFFNNEKINWIELVNKAKLGDAVNKPVLVRYKNTGKLNYGYNFYYPGCKFEEETADIYFCRVGGIRQGSAGQTIVSLPVNKAKNETEWISVSFWNNDKSALADNSYKYLKKGDVCLIVAGKPKDLTNSKVASGYEFHKV